MHSKGSVFSQIHCSIGLSKGTGLEMEEVPEKCGSFEASAYVAVSSLLCSKFSSKSSYQLWNMIIPESCCLSTYERFNEHLGKIGISRHINVDYKNEVLSVEVSYFHKIFFFQCFYLNAYMFGFEPV